jgi:hypothetical protein
VSFGEDSQKFMLIMIKEGASIGRATSYDNKNLSGGGGGGKWAAGSSKDRAAHW